MGRVKRDYWPTEAWRTIEPATVGMDSKKLSGLDHIISSQHKNIHGIVMVKDGYIAFERYYHDYGPCDTHRVASVTKSFTSALVGMAVDSGYISSIDQKVLHFFPDYVTHDIRKKTVTLKHLLTMTAPFTFSWKGNQGGREPLDRLRRQRDWVTYILNQMGGKGQSGMFQYSTAGTHLLSAIITHTTGRCARAFANEHLCGPLGMRDIPDHDMKTFSLDDVFGNHAAGWLKDPKGNSIGGFGLTLTPRDMARFGFLYLNGGMWDNKQIISKAWIDASTTPHAEVKIDETLAKYGYLWWIREEHGMSIYLALGDGGNVICCIPEKDLVVAIAGKIGRKPIDRWPLFETYILPAILD